MSNYIHGYLQALRKAARRELSLGQTFPVRIVPDTDSAPELVGMPGHYTTAHGMIVHSPRAYRAAGGRCFYNVSTQEIRVGEHWRF